ncbi:macro domain-containing protein [Cupriavidus plantarum]|uniref:macro domain-containing protein n=1 Tax=Cupriavidus plantarum TaxID=942865 RepID=UPI000E38C9A4|nr:macro domain-containing protein [Cupriavidus plantarum]REF03034.1 hypothetical protein C7418_1857 [Cupriavidus plantarum]RLK44100.1 hypothetical protein C7417_0076 [Cupriavidus plantarum]
MNIFTDLKKWRFWKHFILKTFACGGVLSGIIQFLIIVSPTSAASFQGLAPLGLVVLCSVLTGFLLSWPRPIEVEFNSPNTKIRIVKGDLLVQDKHLVIGVSDTFDTEPPKIIATTSVQGQAQAKLFNGDFKHLDALLDQALVAAPKTGSITKPGKTDKYGVGTVAVVRNDPRLVFFLAYTEMDTQNNASATVDGVWKSLASLWHAVSVHGNGDAVSIPVIGGGLARLSSVLPAQDSIRLIALSFMFASRQNRVCEELRIVVHPKDYDKLDRMELQSFLSSLRPS